MMKPKKGDISAIVDKYSYGAPSDLLDQLKIMRNMTIK